MNEKIDIKPKFLPPFKRFCMTVGEIPTSYVETMSYYEMLLWFTNYLSKTVIPAINNNAEAVTELQHLFVELQDYVNNYFENLDIQTEIDNKLDAMTESGELQEIIVAYLEIHGVLAFDTLNDMVESTNIIDGSVCKTLGLNTYDDGEGSYYKIRTINISDTVDGINIIDLSHDDLVAEKIKYSNYELQDEIDTINNKEGLYIGTFFKGDDITGKLKLAVSKDGFNFSYINPSLDKDMRDPSIIFKNGKYFIAYTSNSNNYDFKISTSENLTSFVDHEINIGLSSYSVVYAPEWFEDDDELYILISAGSDIDNMSLFKCKCLDLETFTFESPVEININNDDSKIDPYIVKVNSTYYLIYTAVDTDTSTETCKIYTSVDLANWSLLNSNVFPRYWAVEGCCITYQNGRFTIYADMLQSNGYYVYLQTDDLSQTNKTWKISESLFNLRHGTVYYTKDPKAISIISNLTNTNINYTYRQELTHGLDHIALNDSYSRYVIQPKMVYAINGTATIDTLYNPFGLEKFTFCFAGANATTLTINKIQNAEGIIKTVNVTLTNSANRNEKTFEYSLLSECFPPYMP